MVEKMIDATFKFYSNEGQNLSLLFEFKLSNFKTASAVEKLRQRILSSNDYIVVVVYS